MEDTAVSKMVKASALGNLVNSHISMVWSQFRLDDKDFFFTMAFVYLLDQIPFVIHLTCH